MKKKSYETPISEVTEFRLTHVIATSGDGGADTPVNPEE